MKPAVITLLLASCLAGCAATPIGRADLLDFVADGRTTREQAFLELGEPSGIFENGAILTYRLDADEAGYFPSERGQGFAGIRHNLVLVFGPDGILERHSLVAIKVP
jgi:hypothetical protein